jgi:hypothetical protein
MTFLNTELFPEYSIIALIDEFDFNAEVGITAFPSGSTNFIGFLMQ